MRARISLGREDGMSVFEVVLAAFIMFFVLTAVLGLVATTQQFGVSAKQRNLITNTIAARMEYARSLPFHQLGVAGSQTPGLLQPTENFNVGAFTVTVAYDVAPSDAGTKRVRLVVTCGAPGHRTLSTTAYSTVRDRNINLTAFTGLQSPPRVVFLGATPPQRALIYNNLVWSPAGFLDIEVEAAASRAGQKIVSLEIFIVLPGGSAPTHLKSGTTLLAPAAKWEDAEGWDSVRRTFRWHTMQVDADADGNPVRVVPEGWQTIRARAVGSDGLIGTKDYVFFVDNDPPSPAGTPVLSTVSRWVARADWTASPDASIYDVAAYRQRLTGVSGDYTDAASWEASPVASVEALTRQFDSVPFSRYVVTVLARSQRHGSLITAVSQPSVTKPFMSGSYGLRVSGTSGPTRQVRTTATVSVDPPRFPVTGAVTYEFFHRNAVHDLGTGVGQWALAGTVTVSGTATATYTYNHIWLVATQNPYQNHYDYYCRATFTPSGWGGGSPRSVTSNIIGGTSWLSDPPWPDWKNNSPTSFTSPTTPLTHLSWGEP